MKQVMRRVFPLSARAITGGKFLLSLLIYFVIVIVMTVIALILSQYSWFGTVGFHLLISISSVYVFLGIGYAALVYLKIIK